MYQLRFELVHLILSLILIAHLNSTKQMSNQNHNQLRMQ